MLIYKFGGTSLGTPERMKSVADLITRDDLQKVVVLSAVSGTTDTLIKLASAIGEEAEKIMAQLEQLYNDYYIGLLDVKENLAEAEIFLKKNFFIYS
jgi:aspartate kinase